MSVRLAAHVREISSYTRYLTRFAKQSPEIARKILNITGMHPSEDRPAPLDERVSVLEPEEMVSVAKRDADVYATLQKRAELLPPQTRSFLSMYGALTGSTFLKEVLKEEK
jgi:hypothetical protein